MGNSGGEILAQARSRTIVLVLGVFLLGAAFSLMTVLMRAYPENGYVLHAYRLFDLDREANVPTWFSTILWLLAARSAWKAGDGEYRAEPGRTGRLQWRVLAGLAVLMSLDEGAAWHETVGDILTAPGTSVIYGGTLYGVAVLAAAGAFLAPLVRRLDGRTIWLIGSAAGIFVLGAAVLENLGPNFRAHHLYFPQATEELLEESFEMIGVILLLYAIERRRALQVGQKLAQIIPSPGLAA